MIIITQNNQQYKNDKQNQNNARGNSRGKQSQLYSYYNEYKLHIFNQQVKNVNLLIVRARVSGTYKKNGKRIQYNPQLEWIVLEQNELKPETFEFRFGDERFTVHRKSIASLISKQLPSLVANGEEKQSVLSIEPKEYLMPFTSNERLDNQTIHAKKQFCLVLHNVKCYGAKWKTGNICYLAIFPIVEDDKTSYRTSLFEVEIQRTIRNKTKNFSYSKAVVDLNSVMISGSEIIRVDYDLENEHQAKKYYLLGAGNKANKY